MQISINVERELLRFKNKQDWDVKLRHIFCRKMRSLSPKSAIALKKDGRNRQEKLANNRNRNEPAETHTRHVGRTNSDGKTNQTRTAQTKSSSSRTRDKKRPNNGARKRPRRSTHQPRRAAASKSKTNNATKRNSNASRTRTNEKRRTRHDKHQETQQCLITALLDEGTGQVGQ